MRYDYDQRKAMEMIEQLGYRRGGDGVFVDTQNRKLAIDIQASAANAIQAKTMYPVADYWQRAGVTVTTLVIPPQRDSDRAFHAERPGFELPRQHMQNVLRSNYSRELSLPENNFRGTNRARYSNPEYDALFERYLVTIPWTERVGVSARIIYHATDRLPFMTLYYDAFPTCSADKVVNVTNGFTLWNAHEWDIN